MQSLLLDQYNTGDKIKFVHGVGGGNQYCLVSYANRHAANHSDSPVVSNICPILAEFAIGMNDATPLDRLNTIDWRNRADRLPNTENELLIGKRVNLIWNWAINVTETQIALTHMHHGNRTLGDIPLALAAYKASPSQNTINTLERVTREYASSLPVTLFGDITTLLELVRRLQRYEYRDEDTLLTEQMTFVRMTAHQTTMMYYEDSFFEERLDIGAFFDQLLDLSVPDSTPESAI